jgi:hypothetical protein
MGGDLVIVRGAFLIGSSGRRQAILRVLPRTRSERLDQGVVLATAAKLIVEGEPPEMALN